MFIIRNLLDAVNFLTVFKLNLRKKDAVSDYAENKDDITAIKLNDSIKYFPMAGLFIGVILILTFYVFSIFLSDSISILISILLLFILTGGLHFDGLSDTTDGLFAYLKSGEKNRFYSAMKDVNAGISGIIAVIFYVLIMWLTIKGISPKFSYLSLLTFPIVGRYSIVLMSYFSNTPRNFKGIGTIFTEGTNFYTFIIASIFTVVIVFILLKLAGIFALLISTFFILTLAFYFDKKFGGVNGDMLGFSTKISEVIYIITLYGFYKILY